MRKGLFLIVFAVCLLFSDGILAQSANMSINLLDALSFTVNEPIFNVKNNSKNKNDNLIRAIASDHISVVSSKGYVVKAISGQQNGSGPGIEGLVQVSSLIGTTNRGNTEGLILKSDVVLPPANGSPATVITASNSSWNGAYSANKFNIAYKIGNKFAYIDKNAAPSMIPVIFSVIQP
ncbi:hypothetical protein [Daejeonella sp.]|uniref:hypothetical protein n=1 Tax=Daejeonella sp. TaxID=2805397 RepID=UPI0039835528